MHIKTPYYYVDERRILKNLKIIKHIRERSGAKFVLALKCFSTWSVFKLMSRYMDGTTSSSVYEARLGSEKFGKEVHAYSVVFSKEEVKEACGFSDKIIFNSISQLEALSGFASGKQLGLRLNPGISYSHFDLADPARKYSRLGVAGKKGIYDVLHKISGVMFHFNCENNDFANFSKNLDYISGVYGDILTKLDWVSLGGGIYFTKEGYPVDKLCNKLKEFGKLHGVQLYLEPGESSITQSTELVTTVLDVVKNGINIAIVDASTEAHMLDHLIYRTNPKILGGGGGRFKYMVAGRSCLAGDIFGVYGFNKKLKAGDKVKFADAAGYTMVKKNWFNGLPMPSIAVKRINGKIDLIREFNYNDFIRSLS